MTWDGTTMQEIKALAEGKSTKIRAVIRLGVHPRTIERKLRAYREQGMDCFIHGNTGRDPVNKIDFDEVAQFLDSNDVAGSNFTEQHRLLKEYGKIEVSSSCLRKRAFQAGELSVKCKRSTRRKLNKLLKKQKKRDEMTRDQLKMLSALEVEQHTGVWCHPTKPRSKYFGERLEMDASSFEWIKGRGTTTLHVCSDDSSGDLVGLWLEEEETLNGYYQVMHQVLTNHGVPLTLRTDKRSVFIYNKKGAGKPEHDTMTQFAYACSTLGIELGCNSDPDYKPKVERAHQTLQGILPFRFKMEQITTIQQANEYLQQTFIPYFNELFGYGFDYVDGKKKPIGTAFIPCSTEEIHTALAVLCERNVNKGSTIQLNNTYMALLDDQGKRVALPYRTKVTVARLLDGSIYATRDKHCYVLEEVPQRHAFSAALDHDIPKPKPKAQRTRVPHSHPWSFVRQMKFRQSDKLMKQLEPSYVSPYEKAYV